MIASLIENTFNHLLASDQYAQQRLGQHHGQSIGIEVKPMGLQLIATIMREGISLQTGSIQQADCTISGTPIALLRYMNTAEVNPSTNQTLGIEIDGDLEFAREISSIFRRMDIDWEEIASQVIGDAPAFQLTKLVSNFRSDVGRSKDSLKAHLRYVMTDRLDQVVSQSEAEQFYQDVDQIAIDADRLEQQINHLIDTPQHG